MAHNRLWNVVAFANVAAGGSVTTPHLLSNNDEAMTPDFGWVNNTSFSATADATDITVTNNSGAIATVYVLVCAIHTLIRQFGGENFPNLSPKPYWVVGGGSSALVGATTIVRYTAVGGESAFTVSLPVARPNDDYSVFPALAGVASIVGINCPDSAAGDRTTIDFAVETTAALTAGDIIDFLIMDR